MDSKIKVRLLKYSIPSICAVVIASHFFLVNTYHLNRWKGGGYGMYSEFHYVDNKIVVAGLSVDTLIKNKVLKRSLSHLVLMPNFKNASAAAKLIMKSKNRDSVHLQVWRPALSVKSGKYTKVLVQEVFVNKQ